MLYIAIQNIMPICLNLKYYLLPIITSGRCSHFPSWRPPRCLFSTLSSQDCITGIHFWQVSLVGHHSLAATPECSFMPCFVSSQVLLHLPISAISLLSVCSCMMLVQSLTKNTLITPWSSSCYLRVSSMTHLHPPSLKLPGRHTSRLLAVQVHKWWNKLSLAIWTAESLDISFSWTISLV